MLILERRIRMTYLAIAYHGLLDEIPILMV